MSEKGAAKKENPMKSIRVEKLTLNMGAGEAGPKLEKSQKLIEYLTGKKAVVTTTHKRTTFGLAKNKSIGAKITLRGDKAKGMIKKLLGALDNRINPSSFDAQGNFSFGIHEYINIPGVRYDPDIGIMGMDVCVTLERPGFRVKRRRIKSKIGKTHKISREDSMEFAKKEFGIKITENEEE